MVVLNCWNEGFEGYFKGSYGGGDGSVIYLLDPSVLKMERLLLCERYGISFLDSDLGEGAVNYRSSEE